ncbi:type II toxin-antitoxin system RelE/ParE family toxin [Hydrogenimonas thermophila]|uniref:ParE toxin of type II toxin-antitoxin system, parDE n=1 Tax=Hydrogenimonas thermophila TaxID=223786 RepID=A0A1I5U065_9BACT|nr:type II toxin-antitoxin system RelE/ParE family toxin [Hydrogenimonas thermophila]SFP88659.1 ParE toxin of type II toxin-antitoxin system, parDE [Hydrogenimonas thermophila]
MKINRSRRYTNNLFKILEYIAKDKISASENFKNELDQLIDNLPNFPFKYRKSKYFNNKNIRDMIYKGYTIVYRVNLPKNRIDIINIFNKNKPPLKNNNKT